MIDENLEKLENSLKEYEEGGGSSLVDIHFNPTEDAKIIYNAAKKYLAQNREIEFPWLTIIGEEDNEELLDFINHLDWVSWNKGKQDKHGKFLIFLQGSDKTVGAIRCNSKKAYLFALETLRNDI